MTEYLIQSTDEAWFNLPAGRLPDVLRPSSVPFVPIAGAGDWRIVTHGVEVSFSCEDVGVQVVFEGKLPPSIADQIVAEILYNIERATGQRGRVIAL